MNNPSSRRSRSASTNPHGNGDPAVEALAQLIESERSLATTEDAALMAKGDPGRVWLLWFAIGATDEICRFVYRRGEFERNQAFRHVVGLIFGAGGPVEANPVEASQKMVELFESAGAEAVRACMRGDRKLGYYLEALRVGSRLLS
jgi:hypothetical protein